MGTKRECKKNLTAPPAARAINRDIVSMLRQLVDLDAPSPAHPQFLSMWEEILRRFGQYQQEVVRANNRVSTCRPGCAWCCFHWVEDVCSFEAELAARYLKDTRPGLLNEIVEELRGDEAAFAALGTVVQEKLHAYRSHAEAAGIDVTDLCLAGFYQLRRPCPLLDENGTCRVYPRRPMSCRRYLSFSPPGKCRPARINRGDIPTYLLDCDEETAALLEILHRRHNRFTTTSLRSLLVCYLVSAPADLPPPKVP